MKMHITFCHLLLMAPHTHTYIPNENRHNLPDSYTPTKIFSTACDFTGSPLTCIVGISWGCRSLKTHICKITARGSYKTPDNGGWGWFRSGGLGRGVNLLCIKTPSTLTCLYFYTSYNRIHINSKYRIFNGLLCQKHNPVFHLAL